MVYKQQAYTISYFIASAILIFIASYLIIQNIGSFANSQLLTFGVTFDLTFLMAGLYYFFIRRTNIPNITVVPIFVLSCLLARLIIPTNLQEFINMQFNYVIPLLELGVIGFIIFQVRKLSLSLKQSSGTDFVNKFYAAANEIFQNERIAGVFTTEVSMFYYLFFAWKAPKSEKQFSYHRESGIVAILMTIGVLTVVEMFIVHILVNIWNPIIAWILTILSLYTLLQVVSLAKSIILRPITLCDNQLAINYGWFKSVSVPLEIIKEVKLLRNPEINKNAGNFFLVAEMESPNLQILLKESIDIQGVYGITKTSDELLLHLDEPQNLIHALNAFVIAND